MTKTRTEKINETLLESFSLVWEMYKDVLRSVEESQWRQGEMVTDLILIEKLQH
jgi:hypothetical protein